MRTVLFAWITVALLGLGIACADSLPPPFTPPTPTAEPPITAAALRPSSVNPAGAGELAKTISQITGVAISPLLGTGAVGAWRYFDTPKAQRATLPWFAQPWFWVPALILVGLVFAKDALGPTTPTALKKPMDVAEVLENKVSGLIAAGAFVPLAVGIFGSSLPGTAGLDPSSAGLAAATSSQWLNVLLTPFALIAFVAVFLLGHVINVLILLSPFTTVDAALKLLRTALLGTVVGTSFASPTLGAVWAAIIILVSLFFFGWTSRLTVLGSVFIFDVLSRRRRWFRPDPKSNWIFLARTIGPTPIRTYGRLELGESGQCLFHYRPRWFGQPTTIELPQGSYCVGRGFIYADLLKIEGETTTRFGILPPRYKGHEEAITRTYKLAPMREVGLRALWRFLGELFGFESNPRPAVGVRHPAG
ncbi:MAG: hypothetical protein JNK85_18040 [Verrucomicrobiales bacterium]|nr:hypothetical protein [Verrucomicrobiales bacterium]